MRARNEYVKVINGKNEIVMRDVIVDKYLSLFSKSQYEKDASKLYDCNYNKKMSTCFIKFDEPLDYVNGRKLKYKLNSDIITTQKLITTNQQILSENNEISFENFDDDLVSYSIFGKCEQEIIVPKNLYNYQDVLVQDSGITLEENGWIKVDCDNTKGTSEKYINFRTNNLELKENTDYNIICEVEVFENKYTGIDNILNVANHHNSSNTGQLKSTMSYFLDNLGSYAIKKQICTTLDDFSNVEGGLRSFVTVRVGSKVSLRFRISVLEDTSVTTDDFVYQSFVNKSPSPDYPSEIKTLKDELILETNIVSNKKNLYNYQDINVKSDNITLGEDGWLYVECDNTQGTSEKYANFWTNNLDLKENTDYNIIGEIEIFENIHPDSADNSMVFSSRHLSSNVGQFEGNVGYPIDSLGTSSIKQRVKRSLTNFNGVTGGIRSFVTIRIGSKVSLRFRISVLEDTSITVDNFVYHSYIPKKISLIDLQDNELNSVNDICDEFNITTGKLIKRVGKISSYNNEKVTANYISTTGGLDKGATIYYKLEEAIELNLDPLKLPFSKKGIDKDSFDISLDGIANSNGDKQKVITTYFYSTQNGIYNIKNNITENDLNKYANKKITALGFGQNEVMTYFDTINYSITILKDCDFCVSRRDIFSSDAICQGYAYPLHLATITPSITYDDNQYYSTVHARLYSIGLGKTVGEIEDEKIIGRDINIQVVDDTSFKFIVKKGSNQSIHPKTSLYSRSGLYPMPYYTEIELYPNSISFCSNNKYPLASNYKYIIYKYRFYYINRGGQLVDLDQFYTMSLKNDTKGLFGILTKIERS